MKRLCISTLLIVLACSYGANAEWKLTSVVCPGATMSYLLGINNHGVAVGAVDSANDPVPHAFMLKAGKCIPFADETLRTTFSIATGLNDRGDVVGMYVDNAGAQHGFLLDKKGTLTALDFPTANSTWATGITESGKTIVGYWSIQDASGKLLSNHGFIWKDGNFSEVMVESSADTVIEGINARGDYVGAWDADITSLVSHPFVYSNGKTTSFDVPFPTCVGGEGHTINAKGQIAGSCWDANILGTGFVKQGSEFVAITYPGAVSTNVWGINNAGQITGFYFDSNFAPHAFVGQPKR